MTLEGQRCSTSGSAAAGRAGAALRWADWPAVFVPFVALFAATANRGPQWQDPGWHVWRVVTGDLVHPLGLALSHPLHHWMGRLVVSLDLLEPCLAVTLISSIAAATAVANIYGCVAVLTRARAAALLAAASFALSHTLWQMATRAETYTLTAALLSGECWCLVAYAVTRRRGYLYGAFLVNGLGIANHMVASLTTPVLVVVVLHALRGGAIRPKDAVAALGLWLLGSLPYTGLVVAEIVGTGDVSGTVHSALFGHTFADEVLNTTLRPRSLMISAGFVVLNFPNLLLPVAIYGLARAGRLGVPLLARSVLLAVLAIHACFALRYDVPDQYTFFLPSYVLLSIFGGVGFAAVLRSPGLRPRRVVLAAATVTLALTPAIYVVATTIARKFDVLRDVLRDKPYRDDYVYIFTPWSVVERSAERMSREAVTLAGDRGLILVEGRMGEFAVRYRAFCEGRSAVEITHDLSAERINQAVVNKREVVLVPRTADRPTTAAPIGSWKRVGDLYVLRCEQ